MPLRPYQSAAIQAARDLYSQGHRRICLVAPTGSGKTVIGAEMTQRAVADGRPVLWVAHRTELLDQARAVLPPSVQVESCQTLVARGVYPAADLVVLDEAAHYVSTVWSGIAHHYQSAVTIGLTATPERSDGVGLRGIFDALVPVAQPRELIAAGHLVPVHVYGPRQRLRGAIAGDPAAYCTDGTIVFSSSVEDAQALAARVPGAVCVDGGMSASDREAAITGFRDCRIPVLTNVFVLTEGFDAPRASVCVLARGCSSAGAYIQMVGRVMRTARYKTHATVYDLSGACHQHGLPDDDRVYSLDGTAIRASGEAAVALRQCRKCGATFRSVETTCPRCGAYCVVPRTLAQRKLDIERIRETATPESRAAWLDRLRAEAAAKGYSYGWVCHRYKARFGCWPGR